MTEVVTISRGGGRVTFSRSQPFTEETAKRLLHAGAARLGVADPLLICLAGDTLAAEARRLKFSHVEHTQQSCLLEAIRHLPHCAKLWAMGRVDGANTHTFEITE